uniref:Uncharacterized protein n=1 Tax=Solanum lycopersicum TaxID=4081 RepID=A0A3Q7GTJ5_SOLLC
MSMATTSRSSQLNSGQQAPPTTRTGDPIGEQTKLLQPPSEVSRRPQAHNQGQRQQRLRRTIINNIDIR